MPAAPYPLGGDADAVAEDVGRLGGFGVAAHPDSAKAELKWSGEPAVIDGIEWLNLDSEWRDEPRGALMRVALHYVVRPGPALASILDRPAGALERWRAMSARRPVVALAAHDAWRDLRGQRPRGPRVDRAALVRRASAPSRFASFSTRRRAAQRRMRPRSSPRSDVAASSPRSTRLPRRPTSITESTSMAQPSRWAARTALRQAPGRTCAPSLPPDARLLLIRDGAAVVESGGEIDAPLSSPGVYHVEARVPGLGVPWLLSNPVYLRESDAPISGDGPRYVPGASLDGEAQLEKDAASNGTVTAFAEGFEVAYRLGRGARASQCVAAALALSSRPAGGAIVFDGRASRPMRVSVQLRFNASGGARWGRSVYLSPESRSVALPLASLLPLDLSSPMPDPATASSLVVVDLTNAAPGQSGSFAISNLAFASADQRRPHIRGAVLVAASTARCCAAVSR